MLKGGIDIDPNFLEGKDIRNGNIDKNFIIVD